MLAETEKILTKFREINREAFKESARDFKPADPLFRDQDGSYYGDFIEVREIHLLMYSLYLLFDEQIFYGNYDNAYSNPGEPIQKIIKLSDYVKSHIIRLQELNMKYSGQLIPIAITLENYIKTEQMLEYVLGLTEIKNELGDPEKEQLINELQEIKVKTKFKKRKNKIIYLAIFYFIFLIGPMALIIILWDSHSNGKYFQLGLFLFPILSFVYDRKSFIEIFQFTFSGKYRQKLKAELKAEIKRN